MLSRAASSLSGKRPILQARRLWVRACARGLLLGGGVVSMHAQPADTELLAGSNGAGINADFPPACREIPRPAGPYLFDFIPGDATNKNCGMFLSKGR
jgi:hypothetical protein